MHKPCVVVQQGVLEILRMVLSIVAADVQVQTHVAERLDGHPCIPVLGGQLGYLSVLKYTARHPSLIGCLCQPVLSRSKLIFPQFADAGLDTCHEVPTR